MKLFEDMTVDQLKNAIWMLNNGTVPMGGNCDIDEYRKELIRRGLDEKGYHE